MAATPDRTTIRAVVDELLAKLRANLVADPPTAAKPFRRVAVGGAGLAAQPRPVLAIWLTRTRPIGTTDGAKLFEVMLTLRLIADVGNGDAHTTLLDHIGAIEDYVDTLRNTGVLEGADGFDDRIWTFDDPPTSAGARTGSAQAIQSFVVRVEREQNRVPAA